MKPIYFPYTYISSPVAEALAACFGQFIVYQPLADQLPRQMQPLVDNGVIDIKVPVLDDKQELESAANNYLNWAKLHTASSGITTTALKTLKASAAYLDQSLSSQIVSDVKDLMKGSAAAKASDPDSMAKIFLYFAQEFDRQSQELDLELDEYNRQERDLIQKLKVEEDTLTDGLINNYSEMPDVSKDYLIDDRLLAWTRILLADTAPSGLLVTHNTAVAEQLLDCAQTAEKILYFDSIPLTDTGGDELKLWHDELMIYLSGIVEDKFPPSSNDKVEGIAFPAAENTVSLSLYLVPNQIPELLFARCAEINWPEADQPFPAGRLKHTLIGLVEL
jgi:hypothetical protein